MGMAPDVLEVVNRAYTCLQLPYAGSKMCELGNQRLRPSNKPCKQYFTALGVDHTSIDWNGKDGSIKRDLRKPVPAGLIGKFDIVTNCGTSEHVESQQYQVFHNIHSLARMGGAMVHVVPLIGNWNGHCMYRYSSEWFEAVAAWSADEIKMLEIRRSPKRCVICAILIKQSTAFMCESMFDSIPGIVKGRLA